MRTTITERSEYFIEYKIDYQTELIFNLNGANTGTKIRCLIGGKACKR